MKESMMAESSSVEVLVHNIDEPDWLLRAGDFARRVLERLEYHSWDFSILFCDDAHIRELNSTYRNKDSATDVLSFPQIDDPSEIPESGTFFAGDIVISLDTLAENAAYFSVSEEEELKRLIIHGILHLGGWDHSDNSPEQEMLRLQERILAELSKEKIY
jgi:probable rRNA maturation factor